MPEIKMVGGLITKVESHYVLRGLMTDAEKYYLQCLSEDSPTRLFWKEVTDGLDSRDVIHGHVAQATDLELVPGRFLPADEFDVDLEPAPQQFLSVGEIGFEARRQRFGNISIKAEVFQVWLPIDARVSLNLGDLVVLQGKEEVIQSDKSFDPLTQRFFRRHYEYEPEHNQS